MDNFPIPFWIIKDLNLWSAVAKNPFTAVSKCKCYVEVSKRKNTYTHTHMAATPCIRHVNMDKKTC